ncbi:hypothetical protein EVAR_364_1 [Eumeta japonica]|uniref:Uncharacterized protein n=1 Tax=Eumeta variegata TaxID=151549 RepID=A0A4C1SD08_EUMVA|nr:hypothetical protein EVAR_364_1 [Eumeta japonica]
MTTTAITHVPYTCALRAVSLNFRYRMIPGKGRSANDIGRREAPDETANVTAIAADARWPPDELTTLNFSTVGYYECLNEHDKLVLSHMPSSSASVYKIYRGHIVYTPGLITKLEHNSNKRISVSSSNNYNNNTILESSPETSAAGAGETTEGPRCVFWKDARTKIPFVGGAGAGRGRYTCFVVRSCVRRAPLLRLFYNERFGFMSCKLLRTEYSGFGYSKANGGKDVAAKGFSLRVSTPSPAATKMTDTRTQQPLAFTAKDMTISHRGGRARSQYNSFVRLTADDGAGRGGRGGVAGGILKYSFI